MGQYGNQPDFGTRAQIVTPTASVGSQSVNLNSAALYIGTGGTLVATVTGGSLDANGQDIGYTIFTNIPNGTFFPVIVDKVWNGDGGDIPTTCADIIALY